MQREKQFPSANGRTKGATKPDPSRDVMPISIAVALFALQSKPWSYCFPAKSGLRRPVDRRWCGIGVGWMGGRMLATPTALVVRVRPLPGAAVRSLRPFPSRPRIKGARCHYSGCYEGIRRLCRFARGRLGSAAGSCVGEAGALFAAFTGGWQRTPKDELKST
jgi:hypothetical protein